MTQSGRHRAGETLSYPDLCLQALTAKWWVPTADGTIRPGRLIWAHVPHVDQHPHILVTEGRTDPEDHRSADYRIEPFNIKSPPAAAKLPVAGLPHYPEEESILRLDHVQPIGAHGEAYQATGFTLGTSPRPGGAAISLAAHRRLGES